MFNLVIDEEIVLKHVQESDALEMFRLTDSSRETLREWLPWVDRTKSERDSLTFIQLTLEAYEARRGVNCGIFYHGELAGMVSYNLIDWQNRTAHIGYWLGDEFQGRGIMTRAVQGLIDYGFFELDLNRIEIRAAVDNTKSRAIPERLGFRQEGRIRQAEWLYDHFVDHAVYGLLRPEWGTV
jgi:ribosomal-protein-serine acetyltransferase